MAEQFWWVNQTQTFEAERDLGILWAPLLRRDGGRASHWESLGQVRPGDIIFHYAKQRIQGVSRALSAAAQAQRPFETDSWPDVGRKITVAFEASELPVHLSEIGLGLRRAQRQPNSPFQKSGRVNQGYLFRLTGDAGATLLDLLERTAPGADSAQTLEHGRRLGAAAAPQGSPIKRQWIAPATHDLVLSVSRTRGELADDTEQLVTREEFRLQVAFAQWLEAKGTPPSGLGLSTGGSVIWPDHYVKDRGWIVEAKKSEARPYVRLAIGQVLDYVAIAEANGIEATPVILLPRLPTLDLVTLLRKHSILLATPSSDDATDFDVQ